MTQVTIVMQGAGYQLNRGMPASGLQPITAGEHYSRFWMYDTTDVWTHDGWLVTAVESDGVTHHLRKGDQVGRARIEGNQVFRYLPNAQSTYWQKQLAEAS